MANRFWVGGTAFLTPSNTTNWSTTTGGSGGASVPGAGDSAIFDSLSGGGVVTLNFGGAWTVNAITINTFTGTFDNSVNNNNINLSGSGTSFSMTGAGVRTINLGTATYTFNSGGGTETYSVQGATNLTFNASSSNIVFASQSNATQRTVGLGNKSHGNITFGSSGNNASFYTIQNASAGSTIASMTINPPCWVIWPTSAIATITAAPSWVGTFSAGIGFISPTNGLGASISVPLGSVGSYMSFHDITFVTSGGNHLAVANGVAGNNASNITFIAGSNGISASRKLSGM